MAFSGALTLTDLNDYITPSQSCIKPVEQTNKEEASFKPGAAATEICIDENGAYYEVSQASSSSSAAAGSSSGKKLQTAEISLNDCLACSGCITSAESVLITLQSHTEVLSFLSSNPPPPSPSHKTPVISIAPQSLASLAASLAHSSGETLSLDEVLSRVEAFCKESLGFEHVFDTTFARHIALLEHVREFEERRAASAAAPSSATDGHGHGHGGCRSDGGCQTQGEGSCNHAGTGPGKLPMLASACPGWVCYAEKTHAEMLPFISRTKSPQQVMGMLVKEWLGAKWGKNPDEIYHVTVMPCYDKKLEASRGDFYNDLFQTRDVDCVLTTGELDLLMREKGWDLSLPVPLSSSSSPPTPLIPRLLAHPGTSSGSYLHSLLYHITTTSPYPLALSTKTIRSADYEEYILTREREAPEGPEIVFRGAKCYGFRSLQNVVRKVGKEAGVQVGRGAAGRLGGGLRGRVKKTGKGAGTAEERPYDYVEVMACPGGCVNGGGQLRAPVAAKDEEGFTRDWNMSGVAEGGSAGSGSELAARWGDKAWTKQVERAYWDGVEMANGIPTPPASPKMTVGCVSNRDEADRFAGRVLTDVLAGYGVDQKVDWSTRMGAEAEERRRRLFRTEYRAVESEVIGLAVKW